MACPECGLQGGSHHRRATLSAGAKETEEEVARNGIICEMFGAPLWYTFHMLSFGYPEDPGNTNRKKFKKQHYRDMVENWQHTLPCCCCRNNYRQHLRNLLKPAVFDSRFTFTQFVFDLHNEVNRDLGKKVLGPADFAKLRRFYESARAGRDHPYGRAFVVVQEKSKTRKNQNTILMNSKCVFKGPLPHQGRR